MFIPAGLLMLIVLVSFLLGALTPIVITARMLAKRGRVVVHKQA